MVRCYFRVTAVHIFFHAIKEQSTYNENMKNRTCFNLRRVFSWVGTSVFHRSLIFDSINIVLLFHESQVNFQEEILKVLLRKLRGKVKTDDKHVDINHFNISVVFLRHILYKHLFKYLFPVFLLYWLVSQRKKELWKTEWMYDF